MSVAGLDPDIAAMLREAPAHAPYAEIGAPAARETFRSSVLASRPPGWVPEPVAEVRDVLIPGPRTPITVRLYHPEPGTRLPVVVYFHGGGWTIGDLDTHDAQARMVAGQSRALVVSVDYRLAPEHPYPAALEDGLAAVTWAAAEAGTLGADGGRLAVAGDSSGGNLAAAACLWVRDHGGPAIAAQCLVYPVTDLEPDDGSWRAFGQGTNLDAGDMEWFNANYVPDRRRRAEPYASPLRAADLSGLPPAIVATASHDILRDQAEAYARRLEEAGVAVFARRYDGLVHSFFRFSEVSPAAKRANEEICARLRALLHGGGTPG